MPLYRLLQHGEHIGMCICPKPLASWEPVTAVRAAPHTAGNSKNLDTLPLTTRAGTLARSAGKG